MINPFKINLGNRTLSDVPCQEAELETFRKLLGSEASIEVAVSQRVRHLKSKFVELKGKLLVLTESQKAQTYYSFIHDVYSGRLLQIPVIEIEKQMRAIEEEILRIQSFCAQYKDFPGGCDAYFQRQIRIERINIKITSLRGMISKRSVTARRMVSPLAIDQNDLALCLYWAGARSVRESPTIQQLEVLAGKKNAERLLSARIAEKAAFAYFIELGFSLSDVSIQQCTNDNDDWVYYDLLVDDVPVDVKNARGSFSSPGYFVEHCVPQFKISRKNGSEVKVAGVFSNYESTSRMMRNPSKCLVLGWTSRSYVRRLYRWMKCRFGELINIDGVWQDRYFPGWIFEYPDVHYPRRRDSVDLANSIVDEFAELKLAEWELPKWLFAFSSVATPEKLPMSENERIVLKDLLVIRRDLGYTLPAVYLYVLGFVLSGILNRRKYEEVLRPLVSIIFESPESPLGLDDPQKYLPLLIDGIATIYSHVVNSELNLVAFKLTHPLILRGQLSNGNWITLMAYCGGWNKAKMVKCGAVPLLIGVHEVCSCCGLLVCNYCGFCSEACALVVERQKKFSVEY